MHKMYYLNILIIHILLFAVNLISGAKLCQLDDVKCTTRIASGQHVKFIDGILNAVETSDPLRQDLIKGYLPSVKYFFYNATFKGVRNCTVEKLEINPEKSVFHYELACPQIVVDAAYDLKGKVADFIVEGEGPAHIVCDDYMLQFQCYYKRFIGQDNKKHIRIKNYLLEVTPKGKVLLDFKNLSAGDEEKTQALHKFLDKNWKNMDRELRAPAINSFMDLFVENLNSFLNTVSVEELLVDSSK